MHCFNMVSDNGYNFVRKLITNGTIMFSILCVFLYNLVKLARVGESWNIEIEKFTCVYLLCDFEDFS